jgi:hypothetical protein
MDEASISQAVLLSAAAGIWFAPMATEPPDEEAWRKGSALALACVAALWWLL